MCYCAVEGIFCFGGLGLDAVLRMEWDLDNGKVEKNENKDLRRWTLAYLYG